ncbi:MAG: BA14K family protein [Pseudolabrys sp.]
MRWALSVGTALIGALLVLPAAPASSVPLAGGLSRELSSQSASESLILQVQHRRRGDHGRRGHRDGRGDAGAAAAAGILGGLLLGAIIASEAQRRQGIEYCMRRYRSYDPYSQTFVGRDGRRYRCP